MKNKILLALVMASLLTVNSMVCLAAEVPDNQSADITVTGTVEPATSSEVGGISVVVPTKATFIIDEVRNFISPDYTITNNSESAYVLVTAKSLVAISENTCKVVASDKYTDAEWIKLSPADTKTNIALGLKTVDEAGESVKWFNAEGTDTNIVLGQALPNGGEVTTKFSGKYGHEWENAANMTLRYNMTLNIEAIV